MQLIANAVVTGQSLQLPNRPCWGKSMDKCHKSLQRKNACKTTEGI